MKYLVRSGGLIGFPELVEALGQSPAALLEEIGLPVAMLQDWDLYVSYPAMANLLTLAAVRCGTPDFGVRLGTRQGLETTGALGSWLCLEDNVGKALRLLQKNLGFHARGVSIDVEAENERVALEMRFAFAERLDCDQLLGMSMAVLASAVRQLHSTALLPLEVSMALPVPRDDAAWCAAFGRKPSFAAPVSRLVYPARLFALPVQVDIALRERLSTQWRGGWHRNVPVGLRQQVERAIVALLPTGECSLECVASIVGLQGRNLQLRLQRENVSFGRILQQVRQKLAHEHLLRSDIDLTTLSMNLGFGELSVFSRAFKQWTGVSPQTWRHHAAGAPHE